MAGIPLLQTESAIRHCNQTRWKPFVEPMNGIPILKFESSRNFCHNFGNLVVFYIWGVKIYQSVLLMCLVRFCGCRYKHGSCADNETDRKTEKTMGMCRSTYGIMTCEFLLI